MSTTLVCIPLLLSLIVAIHALPSPTRLGIEQGSGDFDEEPSPTGKEDAEDTTVVDPRRIKNFPDFNVGPYECSAQQPCRNGGSCIENGMTGNVCNCTTDYLGPYCEHTAAKIDKALRLHPLFKVSFAECLTKAGEAAGIDTHSILSKCGSGRNMCWVHEGGVKGLNCFFWCLSETMEQTMTEATPSEETRVHLFAEVFQKLAHERSHPTPLQGPKPKGMPVASLQINLYDTSDPSYPFPKHGTIGISGINIQPVWSFMEPPTTTTDQHPKNGPYDSHDESGRDEEPQNPPPPEDSDFEFPKSHELPTPSVNEQMNPLHGQAYSPYYFNFYSSPSYEDYFTDSPTRTSLKEDEHQETNSEPPNDNNLINTVQNSLTEPDYRIVESGSDDDDTEEEIPASAYSFFPDLSSNMRGRR